MRLLSFIAAGVSMLAVQTSAQDNTLFQDFDHFTKETFEEVVLSDVENMWLVTFYADWCPYCQPVYQ